MTIPAGQGYPKMATGSDGVRSVPLIYPAGDPKQYQFVILNSAAEEAAYTGNGVLVSVLVSPPSSSHGNGWSNGQWKK